MTIEDLTDAEIVEAVDTAGATIAVPLFDGQPLGIYAELDDLTPERAVSTVRNLLAKDPSELADIGEHLLKHYQTVVEAVSAETVLMDGAPPTVATVWDSVKLGMLQLTQVGESSWEIPTYDAEKPVYVVLDLNVAWYSGESVIVSWEDGVRLVKVGAHGSPVDNIALDEAE